MVSAMTNPTTKKPDAVPTRTAPSRSTDNGMNGSSAAITRQANKAHNASEALTTLRIGGEPQA